jgi:BirA family biotin operon repressor/biotin-[acetyl-CoA-carboxylase] ligase
MRQQTIENALLDLPIGPQRFFPQIGSTNDEAARWAEAGAPDLSLVIADEQTAGRGRRGRKWLTPPGSALAFSLVLRPKGASTSEGAFHSTQAVFARLTALGALAIHLALQKDYGLPSAIKWPNDVLIDRRKVAGVLAEGHWLGNHLSAEILGIGINVAPPSVPPDADVAFPATCVEAVLGHPLAREQLLRHVLGHLLDWRERCQEAEFLPAWEEALAFRGEWVYLVGDMPSEDTSARRAQVLGLDASGGLRLRDEDGASFTIYTGEVRLRPPAPG